MLQVILNISAIFKPASMQASWTIIKTVHCKRSAEFSNNYLMAFYKKSSAQISKVIDLRAVNQSIENSKFLHRISLLNENLKR